MAPSTTNHNATQRIYKKYIKWLGNPYRHTVLKMQYENVFKSDRWCSCYTCLPKTAPATQTAQKMDAPSTGTGAPQMDQRLLTITWPKTIHNINIKANKCKH